MNICQTTVLHLHHLPSSLQNHCCTRLVPLCLLRQWWARQQELARRSSSTTSFRRGSTSRDRQVITLCVLSVAVCFCRTIHWPITLSVIFRQRSSRRREAIAPRCTCARCATDRFRAVTCFHVTCVYIRDCALMSATSADRCLVGAITSTPTYAPIPVRNHTGVHTVCMPRHGGIWSRGT